MPNVPVIPGVFTLCNIELLQQIEAERFNNRQPPAVRGQSFLAKVCNHDALAIPHEDGLGFAWKLKTVAAMEYSHAYVGRFSGRPTDADYEWCLSFNPVAGSAILQQTKKYEYLTTVERKDWDEGKDKNPDIAIHKPKQAAANTYSVPVRKVPSARDFPDGKKVEEMGRLIDWVLKNGTIDDASRATLLKAMKVRTRTTG